MARARGRVPSSLARGLTRSACLAPLAVALLAQPAAAACGAEGPWVALAFEGGQDWPKALREDARADLRAGLRLRGIDVCDADSVAETKPVALLTLHISAATRVRVSLDLRDAITDKRVLRDVDLHSVAPDARGLLLAQAADELLRASWVELAVEDAPEPAMPPPAEVATIALHAGPAAALRPTLGVRGALEYYSGGQTLLGADAFLDVWLMRHLGISFGLGLRGGLGVDAADGRINTHTVQACGDVFASWWPAEKRYNLLVSVGLQIADVVVSGRAAESARAQQLSALGATARAGLWGFWQVAGSLRLSLQLEPGLSIRSVAARDNGQVVASTSGLALQATVGLGGVL
jgi:hypothetical protein